MRALILLALVASLLPFSADAGVYSIPAIRMPAMPARVSAPSAPVLNIAVPVAPVAPSLAAILAARGFNLASMPRR